MARTNRRDVFDETKVGTYHCINRCVRRAFLCGNDPLSGKNFDHRKEWVRARLEFLAGQFGIDVNNYAVLDNHLHVILRNRPDVVAQWSDEEVARRWWTVFPKRKDNQGNAAVPEAHELAMMVGDAVKLAKIRQRLSHISWFMRCLCEKIAKAANFEDQCSGRFFQGRFKMQPLLDESAILACSMYVDLNPIRAGVATTPETSQYTSAYDRIQARQALKELDALASVSARRRKLKQAVNAFAGQDGWLSRLELGRELDDENDPPPQKRASNKGFLPMTLDQYLTLLDWTGRQVRQDKLGSIPADLEPILTRLGINSDMWVESVRNFGRWFRRAAGRAESLAAEAARRGQRWLQGMSHSKAAFT